MSKPLLVVLRPLGLGDFLTGIPAYRAIARKFPDHRRVLAVPAALHALIPATRAFDLGVDVEPLTKLPLVLSRADISIDLHGKGPASHRILLDAQPRRLIAFANAEIPESRRGAVWRADEHEVQRWCRMLETAGVPADPRDLYFDPQIAPAHREGRVAIVHPGAASEARRWPIERWMTVVRALQHRGHRVVLTGSAAEAKLTATIARQTDGRTTVDLGGRTNLAMLVDIVSKASLVLSTDTGIAHLAVACGTPTITIFGPTSPKHWGPPTNDRHGVLWAGETGDPHGETIDPGLLSISVSDVLGAVEQQAFGRSVEAPAKPAC